MAKVLLYDSRGAQPFARIISVVVVGATFYIGGMLYQRLAGFEPQPDPSVRGRVG